MEVTKRDLTNDGTEDIRLENGRISVQLNGEDLGSRGNSGRKVLLSSGSLQARSAQGNSLGRVTTQPQSDIQTNGNLPPEFRSTDTFRVVRDSQSMGSFRVKRNYYTFGRDKSDRIPMEIDAKVTLNSGDNFVLIDITYRNEGTKSFILDTDPGHIHDGTKLLSKISLFGRSQNQHDYRFFLPGQGVRYFKNQAQWRTYPPTAWGTFFDNDDATTYGVIDGPTGPKMWIHNQGDLDHFRGELQLKPAEQGSYSVVIGIHTGGENAQVKGREIIEKAQR